jgi:hypothetical protein
MTKILEIISASKLSQINDRKFMRINSIRMNLRSFILAAFMLEIILRRFVMDHLINDQ